MIYTLISQVLPRAKTIQMRVTVYADRKAKYKRMARSNDPAQIQEELDVEKAKFLSLDTEHKKLETKIKKLQEDFTNSETARRSWRTQYNNLNESHQNLTDDRNAWRTRATEAEKKYVNTMNQLPHRIEQSVKEALIKFCHSKAFNFAASLHCLDEAQKAFNLAIEQGIFKGVTDPSARGMPDMGLMFNERCVEEDEDREDPESNISEPEYNFLVTLIQDAHMAAHPPEGASQAEQKEGDNNANAALKNPPSNEPAAPIVNAPVPANQNALVPLAEGNEPIIPPAPENDESAPPPAAQNQDEQAPQAQGLTAPVQGPVARNVLVVLDEDIAPAA